MYMEKLVIRNVFSRKFIGSLAHLRNRCATLKASDSKTGQMHGIKRVFRSHKVVGLGKTYLEWLSRLLY